MHTDNLDTVRQTLQKRVFAKSLRGVAREVGLTASGLLNFLEGAAPYHKTIRKLDAWYERHLENDHRDRQQILIEELLLTLPLHRRTDARHQLTSIIVSEGSPSHRRTTMLPPNATESRKRIGICLRLTAEDHARGESLKEHEERARNAAEAKGWAVVEAYYLDEVIDEAVLEHDEAKRMMEDVKTGHITGLLISDFAQLTSSAGELFEFSEFLQKHGADLISLKEHIDTTSSTGHVPLNFLAAVARFEREIAPPDDADST